MASRQLGEQVRAARKQAGITQADLAKRMQSSPTYITNLEAGRANPTVGQIAHIANALGMSYAVSFQPIERREVRLSSAHRG
ncbi:MAG: helix-turn-helix domain-containing protein [Thermoleophilaceae bacterium]